MEQTVDQNTEVTLAASTAEAKPLRVRCDVSDLTGATFYLYTHSGNVLLSGNLRLPIGREGTLWLPSDLVPDEPEEPEPAVELAGEAEAGTAGEAMEAKDRQIALLEEERDGLKREIEESPMQSDEAEKQKLAAQEKELLDLQAEHQAFEGASRLLSQIFSETLEKMSVARLESLQAEEFLPQIEGKKTDRVRQLEKHYAGQTLDERARLVAKARAER